MSFPQARSRALVSIPSSPSAASIVRQCNAAAQARLLPSGRRVQRVFAERTVSPVSLTLTRNLTPVVSAGGALEIDAPYISLTSTIDQLTNSSAAAGTGSVLFKADDIDITGAVIFDQSVANATLRASGDIRLTGVQQYQVSYVSGYLPSTSTLDGGLVVNGNLSIVAGQVYPSTGSTFTISSTAANGTISFAALRVERSRHALFGGRQSRRLRRNIVQDGIVRVPFGMLTLEATRHHLPDQRCSSCVRSRQPRA